MWLVQSSHCAVTTKCFFSSFCRAGVGSAVEGGRGRAGTKLFQDFQMLSRIWTHPWCLQLDYISKENKVNEQPASYRLLFLHQHLKATQGNAGVSSQSSVFARSQSRRAQQALSERVWSIHVTRTQVLCSRCCRVLATRIIL